MYILLVRYKCKPGCRDSFYRAVTDAGIDAGSRAEQGNIRYEYSFGTADDELILTELWRDEQTLESHRTSAHMAKLGAIKSEYVESTEIVRYKAEQI